ncbi:hypothetical protein D9758_017321 [Tetrapyrgos nigripes]|uniref:Uncharacterized protein n=1 Tax=Tetrapyrgos nigripes TaxID=182062 RepID=A0A8H5BSP9_9AGAR|nr:hypothetical protein D9758_017321 [Tetrapyrgos nigripes]
MTSDLDAGKDQITNPGFETLAHQSKEPTLPISIGQGSNTAILRTLLYLIQKSPNDKKLNELAGRYRSYFNKILESKLESRLVDYRSRANYLSSQATVAAFLAGVQIGFMQFSFTEDFTITRRVVDIFSACAIYFDVLGALFALTIAHSHLKISASTNEMLEEKDNIDGLLRHTLDSMKNIIGRIGKAVSNLDRQNRIVKEHSVGDLGALLVIISGVICFFVSPILYVIDTQPVLVWLPTLLAVILVAGYLMRNERKNHPGEMKSLARSVGLIKQPEKEDVQALWRALWRALLSTSLREHSEEEVEMLLDKGADPNIQDDIFGTALLVASHQGLGEIVGLLLDNGADPNIRGGEHGTALCAASHQGSKEIVELLLDKGVDPNIQGGKHGTALCAASHQRFKEIVELLLDEGADPNIQGGEHGAAFCAASCQGFKEIVELLLEKGADPNIQGGEHGTALCAASHQGFKEIVELLLDKGADPNIPGPYSTALLAAASGGNLDIVKCLVERGADVNAKGGELGSALQAAKARGNREIVRYLEGYGATE